MSDSPVNQRPRRTIRPPAYLDTNQYILSSNYHIIDIIDKSDGEENEHGNKTDAILPENLNEDQMNLQNKNLTTLENNSAGNIFDNLTSLAINEPSFIPNNDINMNFNLPSKNNPENDKDLLSSDRSMSRENINKLADENQIQNLQRSTNPQITNNQAFKDNLQNSEKVMEITNSEMKENPKNLNYSGISKGQNFNRNQKFKDFDKNENNIASENVTLNFCDDSRKKHDSSNNTKPDMKINQMLPKSNISHKKMHVKKSEFELFKDEFELKTTGSTVSTTASSSLISSELPQLSDEDLEILNAPTIQEQNAVSSSIQNSTISQSFNFTDIDKYSQQQMDMNNMIDKNNPSQSTSPTSSLSSNGYASLEEATSNNQSQNKNRSNPIAQNHHNSGVINSNNNKRLSGPNNNKKSNARNDKISTASQRLPNVFKTTTSFHSNVPHSSSISPTLNSGSSSSASSGSPTKKIKKKRDPNEPQKPVSAYALFFRDTQAAIKGQNPTASFGEVSKIVAAMWDALDQPRKETYKRKTEMAKKDYIRKLADYRMKNSSTLSGNNGKTGEGYVTSYKPFFTNLNQNSHADHLISPSNSKAKFNPNNNATKGDNFTTQQNDDNNNIFFSTSKSKIAQNNKSSQHSHSNITNPASKTALKQQNYSTKNKLQNVNLTKNSKIILNSNCNSNENEFNSNNSNNIEKLETNYINIGIENERAYIQRFLSNDKQNINNYSNILVPGNDNQSNILNNNSNYDFNSTNCQRFDCQNYKNFVEVIPNENLNRPTEPYCSDYCVVSHCKDVFNYWILNPQTHNTTNPSTIGDLGSIQLCSK